MSNPSLLRTFSSLVLMCILVALQPCAQVLAASMVFDGQSENNGSEDSNESESDDSLIVSDVSFGKRCPAIIR